MGCYLETDFVTRLPIFRGDEVLALFGYNVNMSDKYYNECLHPFHGRFDPKMDCTHRIRCFFGTYNEYGWIEESNDHAYELMEKGYPLMIRKETYLYLLDEYRNTPVDEWNILMNLRECRNASKTEKALGLVDGDVSMKDLLEKYKFDGLMWGLKQMRYDLDEDYDNGKRLENDYKTYAKSRELFDDEKSAFKFVEEKTHKLLSEECNGLLFKYASDYSEIIKPIVWFCMENRIIPEAARYCGGEQYSNCQSSERLGKFIGEQARKFFDAEW